MDIQVIKPEVVEETPNEAFKHDADLTDGSIPPLPVEDYSQFPKEDGEFSVLFKSYRTVASFEWSTTHAAGSIIYSASASVGLDSQRREHLRPFTYYKYRRALVRLTFPTVDFCAGLLKIVKFPTERLGDWRSKNGTYMWASSGGSVEIPLEWNYREPVQGTGETTTIYHPRLNIRVVSALTTPATALTKMTVLVDVKYEDFYAYIPRAEVGIDNLIEGNHYLSSNKLNGPTGRNLVTSGFDTLSHPLHMGGIETSIPYLVDQEVFVHSVTINPTNAQPGFLYTYPARIHAAGTTHGVMAQLANITSAWGGALDLNMYVSKPSNVSFTLGFCYDNREKPPESWVKASKGICGKVVVNNTNQFTVRLNNIGFSWLKKSIHDAAYPLNGYLHIFLISNVVYSSINSNSVTLNLFYRGSRGKDPLRFFWPVFSVTPEANASFDDNILTMGPPNKHDELDKILAGGELLDLRQLWSRANILRIKAANKDGEDFLDPVPIPVNPGITGILAVKGNSFMDLMQNFTFWNGTLEYMIQSDVNVQEVNVLRNHGIGYADYFLQANTFLGAREPTMNFKNADTTLEFAVMDRPHYPIQLIGNYDMTKISAMNYSITETNQLLQLRCYNSGVTGYPAAEHYLIYVKTGMDFIVSGFKGTAVGGAKIPPDHWSTSAAEISWRTGKRFYAPPSLSRAEQELKALPPLIQTLSLNATTPAAEVPSTSTAQSTVLTTEESMTDIPAPATPGSVWIPLIKTKEEFKPWWAQLSVKDKSIVTTWIYGRDVKGALEDYKTYKIADESFSDYLFRRTSSRIRNYALTYVHELATSTPSDYDALQPVHAQALSNLALSAHRGEAVTPEAVQAEAARMRGTGITSIPANIAAASASIGTASASVSQVAPIAAEALQNISMASASVNQIADTVNDRGLLGLLGVQQTDFGKFTSILTEVYQVGKHQDMEHVICSMIRVCSMLGLADSARKLLMEAISPPNELGEGIRVEADETEGLTGKLLAGVVMALGLKATGATDIDVPSSRTLMGKLASRAKDFSATTRGVADMTKVYDFIKNSISEVGNVIGLPGCSVPTAPEKQFIEDCDTFLGEIQSIVPSISDYANVATDAAKREKIKSLYAEHQRLERAVLTLNAPGIVPKWSKTSMVYTELSKQLQGVCTEAPYKFEPFVVCVAGDPGVGKSMFAGFLASLLNYSQKDDPNDVWAYCAAAEYHNGYACQAAVVVDDPDQNKEDAKFPNFFISVKSSVPTGMNMPDIASKNRTFRSKLMVLASNTMYPPGVGVVDQVAYNRRRDLLAQARMRRGTAKAYDFSHLVFDNCHPVNNSITGPIIQADLNVRQFCIKAIMDYWKYSERQYALYNMACPAFRGTVYTFTEQEAGAVFDSFIINRISNPVVNRVPFFQPNEGEDIPPIARVEALSELRDTVREMLRKSPEDLAREYADLDDFEIGSVVADRLMSNSSPDYRDLWEALYNGVELGEQRIQEIDRPSLTIYGFQNFFVRDFAYQTKFPRLREHCRGVLASEENYRPEVLNGVLLAGYDGASEIPREPVGQLRNENAVFVNTTEEVLFSHIEAYRLTVDANGMPGIRVLVEGIWRNAELSDPLTKEILKMTYATLMTSDVSNRGRLQRMVEQAYHEVGTDLSAHMRAEELATPPHPISQTRMAQFLRVRALMPDAVFPGSRFIEPGSVYPDWIRFYRAIGYRMEGTTGIVGDYYEARRRVRFNTYIAATRWINNLEEQIAIRSGYPLILVILYKYINSLPFMVVGSISIMINNAVCMGHMCIMRVADAIHHYLGLNPWIVAGVLIGAFLAWKFYSAYKSKTEKSKTEKMYSQALVESDAGEMSLKIQDHYHRDLPLDGVKYKHIHMCDECGEIYQHTHAKHTYEISKTYGNKCLRCRKKMKDDADEETLQTIAVEGYSTNSTVKGKRRKIVLSALNSAKTSVESSRNITPEAAEEIKHAFEVINDKKKNVEDLDAVMCDVKISEVKAEAETTQTVVTTVETPKVVYQTVPTVVQTVAQASDVAKAEASACHQADDFLRHKVRNNTGWIRISGRTLNYVGLTTNIILTNAHALTRVGSGREETGLIYRYGMDKPVSFTFHTEKDVYRWGKQSREIPTLVNGILKYQRADAAVDRILIRINNRSIPQFSDLYKSFIRQNQLDRAVGFPASSIDYIGSDENPTENVDMYFARIDVHPTVTLRDEGVPYVNVNTFTYDRPTRKGMCGSAIVSRGPAISGGRILGIHSFGFDRLDRGGSQFITYEELNAALEEFCPPVVQCNAPSIDSVLEFVDLVELEEGSPIPEGKPYHVLGELEKPYFEPHKSQIRPSPLFDKFQRHVSEPAVLSKKDPRNKTGISPHLKAVNKFKCAGGWRERSLIRACDYLVKKATKMVGRIQGPLRPLTIMEAINGIPGCIESLNMSTACGFPYDKHPERKPGDSGKLWMFNQEVTPEGITHYPKDWFLEDINKALQILRTEGRAWNCFYKDQLKDERRKLTKIVTADTREFNVNNALWQVIMKMYYAPIQNFLMQTKEQFHNAVGFNMFGQDVTRLCQHLRKCDKFFALDVSQWDGTFDQQTLYYSVLFCAELLKSMMKYQMYAQDQIEEVYQMVKKVGLCMVSVRVHVWGKVVYLCYVGMPSGIFSTIILNTIGWMIRCFATADEIITEQKLDVTLEQFDQMTVNVFLGDDSINGVSGDFGNYWNAVTISEKLSSKGIKAVPPSKDGREVQQFEEWDDLIFLKCSFRESKEFPGMWHAMIDAKNPVGELSNWIRNTLPEDEATVTNCDDMLRFTYARGEDKFNEMKMNIDYLLRGSGLPLTSVSFEECADAWRIEHGLD